MQFPIRFGKYLLCKHLARGGMGEIYLALTKMPLEGEQFCVIKRVRASHANESIIRRFVDEVKVATQLRHENLVHVFDAGWVENEAYLGMEYVEGHDLRSILSHCEKTKSPLPLDVALYIVSQLCHGLAYTHRYGNLHLVHRDICPSNILISYQGEVKITDFGLAHSILKAEHTAPGKIFGHLSYLAPEQAQRSKIDERTDLYSASVVLWELLVGQPMRPGSHADPLLTFTLARSGRIVPPSSRNPNVPVELDAIVEKGLQAEPHLRYASAQEMGDTLINTLARISPDFNAAHLAKYMQQLFPERIATIQEEKTHWLNQYHEHAKHLDLNVMSSSKSTFSRGVVANRSIIGTVIDGRYRVIQSLGEGGMGGVYEAEHVEIGRRVALKILHAALSDNPETMARFRAEARAATRIAHPNIIEIFDSGITNEGCFYYAMELLTGIDLAQVMEKERIMPLSRALPIVLQICQALQAAHRAGIVHRDLKPENIFLIERENHKDWVKILDFGIAKNLQEEGLTQPGVAIGTPEYMAPEQITGSKIDHRADIYALGAILFEMLTGHLPHEGESLKQLLSHKLSTPPQRIRTFCPQLSVSLEHAIQQALATYPDQRFSSMQEFADAISLGVSPEPRSGDSTSMLPGAKTPQPRLSPSVFIPLSQSPSSSIDQTIPFHRTPLPESLEEIRPSQLPVTSFGSVVERSSETKSEPSAIEVAETVLTDPALPKDDTWPTPPPLVDVDYKSDVSVFPAKRSWSGKQYYISLLVLGGLAGLTYLMVVLIPRHLPTSSHSLSANIGDSGLLKNLKVDVRGVVLPDSRLLKVVSPIIVHQSKREVKRLVEKAKQAAAAGDYLTPRRNNVLELLQRAERRFPGHSEIEALRRQLGRQLEIDAENAIEHKQFMAADQYLRIWTALNPKVATPIQKRFKLNLLLARKDLARRQYREALDHARMALKLNPSSGEALELLGDIAWRRKKYESAAKLYQKALSSGPLYPKHKQRLTRKIVQARKKSKTRSPKRSVTKK